MKTKSPSSIPARGWRCLTASTHPRSRLRLFSPAVIRTNVTVSWQRAAGVDYFVERSTDLGLPFSSLATGIAGQAGKASLRTRTPLPQAPSSNDAAVWLATSKDMKTRTNVQDDPVLRCGPEAYDRYAVAVDQIFKHHGQYYAYYHASALPKWSEWTTCIAMSEDLVHWKKHPGNPIVPVNRADPGRSSGMVVHDGERFHRYTTHPDVRVHFPKEAGLVK